MKFLEKNAPTRYSLVLGNGTLLEAGAPLGAEISSEANVIGGHYWAAHANG
jgi:hypothetical protein